MPMTSEEIAAAPRHPQLMAPAEPEELIEASIWWYPTLFAHRTAVLQHLLLTGGNGYEWGEDGQVHSVFAHLEPDYHTLAERMARFDAEPGAEPADAGKWRREDLARSAAIRGRACDWARLYGPVTISRSSRTCDRWGLMAARPQRVHPRWQALLDEAGRVFGRAWAVQDAAEAELRREWDVYPAARAAQLLTRELGRAWAADEVTDAELADCDRVLAGWRHPARPSRIDLDSLRVQRDRNREQRRIARQVLAELAAGREPASAAALTPETSSAGADARQARPPLEVLKALATEHLVTVSSLVRPVPFTGWQEWDWTLDRVRQQLETTSPGLVLE
jgi:hypothetical protein